mmetsp:Transcript_17998/g.38008  ORF Transcript_17998/g.38008 Transcript_17998/m.38008 type:complete len:210 (-) Transcript_17998:202-831(-)
MVSSICPLGDSSPRPMRRPEITERTADDVIRVLFVSPIMAEARASSLVMTATHEPCQCATAALTFSADGRQRWPVLRFLLSHAVSRLHTDSKSPRRSCTQRQSVSRWNPKPSARRAPKTSLRMERRCWLGLNKARRNASVLTLLSIMLHLYRPLNAKTIPLCFPKYFRSFRIDNDSLHISSLIGFRGTEPQCMTPLKNTSLSSSPVRFG